MAQLELGAKLLPQELCWTKSAELVVALAIVRDALPVFVSVTVWVGLEVPTYWFGKVILDGDKVAGLVTVSVKLCDASVPTPLCAVIVIG